MPRPASSMSSQGVLLEIRGLRAAYERVEVLHGIDLVLERGEFVCVIGANTAGKSTLLRAVSRLVQVTAGSICFAGEDLLRRPAHRLAEAGIAHVPEGRHVFPALTVEENLLMGAFAVRRTAAVRERLDEVYALFGHLKHRRRQAAGTLSGGEQQMVSVGRALMPRPQLLLLDEPSHGLAPIIVEQLHGALGEIHARGVSILLVEQNTAMALSVAQRGYVLESGRIVLEGTAESLAGDDRVRSAYLGL
jgi:branched-chain amino acid transport system ATP-binding protein